MVKAIKGKFGISKKDKNSKQNIFEKRKTNVRKTMISKMVNQFSKCWKIKKGPNGKYNAVEKLETL